MTQSISRAAVALFLVCSFSFPSWAESGMDMKLLNATLPFQICAHTTTDRELAQIGTTLHKGKKGPELEGAIWGKVLDECKRHLGDTEKGLILLHYGGNNAKALGYWEGVVYSARAYVIDKTISYEQAKRP